MQVIPIYPTGHEANTYIAVCGSSCAVIDPGDGASRIYKRCTDKGLKIEKILLTHAHFDHIIAVNELCALCGAEIVIHRGDFPALYNPSLNLSVLGTGKGYVTNSDINVTAVEDGDKIPVGDKEFSVMSTPGHTPGSCLYICDNIIFTGDTLFAGTIGRTDFPGGDVTEMKRSLKRICDLPGDYTLYSGHSGETSLDRERSFNYYLRPEFCDF